ncbi:rhodanese-like domain-containing protein [Ancylomarina longa]|uniref:Rhodanese-like domain-containing protein n=1 Tax=Ancylomarina longa TaxID=2487017 RepID=A0A434AZR6_9BACT|nr:rhodanese-like domain-containing protein [Ancylomarina longa]RUT79947.1 rhodanese-like domain-containing protein [Ancylomarina longa]
MKKLLKYLLILALVPTLFLSSCKKDDSVVVGGDNSFEILTTYLVDNDMDLPDVLTGWIVAAPAAADVATFIDTYDILDIRSAADYANGHIEGAVNSTLGNILVDAQNTTKPLLVVCYTGQTAAHAVVALRLSGYLTAKVLKWGMSGWNSTLSGKWEANSGDVNGAAAIGNVSWTTDPIAGIQSFEYPALIVTSTTGPAILEERVESMISGGFKGVSATDVLTNPTNYFINNFWAQADVDHYGHIVGAHRINPLSIENGEIANIDPDATVVTYCWTGQTSSMVTAYLNVLGYNALSLKFGANSMIYPNLEVHKFVTPTTDLPLSTD